MVINIIINIKDNNIIILVLLILYLLLLTKIIITKVIRIIRIITMSIWLQSWCWCSGYDLCLYAEGPGSNFDFLKVRCDSFPKLILANF